MKNKIKNKIRKYILRFLDIEFEKGRVDILENLLYHKEAYNNGYAVLKKHLNPPNKPLPMFMGKEIEQD